MDIGDKVQAEIDEYLERQARQHERQLDRIIAENQDLRNQIVELKLEIIKLKAEAIKDELE